MFKYETSKISWCEDKYIYNNNIVEYWNTFSNIIFIFASIYGIFKIYYDKNDMKYFYNLFLFLGIVGICSTIYHMTLSLFGQLLDEWAICILLISCIWKILKLPIYFLKYFILTLSIAMLLRPEYNHKILMIIGIISSIFLIYEYYITYNQNKINTFKIAISSFFIALFFWVDKFNNCYIHKTFSIPTHSLWHIFMAFSSYHIIFFIYQTNKKKII
tara:strand:+ start:1585 stop:2232 length:648 start_codon:yes stop_codon:yes gene_type:complete